MRRVAALLLLLLPLLVSLTAASQQRPEALYIANGMNRSGKGGAITAYKIDPESGKLSPVIGSPFDAGLIPYGLATDDGSHLYLANPALDDNNLRTYPIRPDTGRLEVEHTSTFESSNYEAERNCCPGPMLADRAGRFVYVGNTSGKEISVNEVSPDMLALTQVSKAYTRPGHFPVAIIWGPKQESLFAFTDAGLSVSLLHIYRRDPQKGSLIEAKGSPLQVPNLIQITASDSQLFALTKTPKSSQIIVYDVHPDLTLTPSGSPVLIEGNADKFALDRANKLLAVASEGQATVVTLFAAEGSLRKLQSIKLGCLKACSVTSIAFNATGKFLYLADGKNENIVGLNVSSLQPISGSPWKSNFQPHSLLVVELH